MNISVGRGYQIKNKIIKMMRIMLLEVVNETMYIDNDYYYEYIKYLMNKYLYQVKVRKRGKVYG